MDGSPTRNRGRAKLTLGLSILFAVGGFAYFWLSDAPFQGVGVGVLVLLAGYWEYRRTLQDQRTAERYEREAEAQRQKDRR